MISNWRASTCGFGGGGDRDVVKRHVVAGRQLVKLAVVADDGANVQRQQAAFPAKQQVVEAMPLFADQDDGAHGLVLCVQLAIASCKRLGKRAKWQL
jgi:hypothetical protein